MAISRRLESLRTFSRRCSLANDGSEVRLSATDQKPPAEVRPSTSIQIRNFTPAEQTTPVANHGNLLQREETRSSTTAPRFPPCPLRNDILHLRSSPSTARSSYVVRVEPHSVHGDLVRFLRPKDRGRQGGVVGRAVSAWRIRCLCEQMSYAWACALQERRTSRAWSTKDGYWEHQLQSKCGGKGRP